MRWSGWILGALVVTVAPAARAQNMNMGATPRMVTGRVFDDTTGCPLPAAKISVVETGHSAMTDANGRYRLANPMMAKFSLQASKNGYRARRHDSVTVTDSAARVDFSLMRAWGDSAMNVKYPPAKCHLEPTGAKADSSGHG